MNAYYIETPLGLMLAIADEKVLYSLEFRDSDEWEPTIRYLQNVTQTSINFGLTEPLRLIKKEINLYFQSKLRSFKTPLHIKGTAFQMQVWRELQKIPYGQTYSYLKLAQAVRNPKACRAVAQANKNNRFAIIIPCHRVIYANGELGGYNGRVTYKQWLLDHERKNFLQRSL